MVALFLYFSFYCTVCQSMMFMEIADLTIDYNAICLLF